MSQLLDLVVFRAPMGGHLNVIAVPLAFGEILSDDFKSYGKQVISNCRQWQAFVSRGYNLISNGTDNHLMLIDLQ